MQTCTLLLLLTMLAAPTIAQVPADLMLIDAVPNDTFSQPLAVRAANDGSGRLFVVEKCGTIKIIKNGAVLATPFLTLNVSCNSEQGSLGLAFDPNYASNGVFYVAYTDLSAAIGTSNDQVLGRFTVSANPDIANPAGTVVMRVPDIAGNHNGGDIHFGADGYLYWSMGDGGVQQDPNGFAQCLWKKHADNNASNCSTSGGSGALYYLLGKILRLDVDHTTNSAQANACASTTGAHAEYSIPATNPYATVANTCAEIWAYGLRNPYRFSFDRQTHDMLIGDVGQDTTEEIDFQPAASSAGSGYNYGWNICEGPFLRGSTTSACGTGVLPILHYVHSASAGGCDAAGGAGCAVIGGFRYRGPYSRLQGFYLFADLTSGVMIGSQAGTWSFTTFTPNNVTLANPFGFGEDEAGNVYLADGGAGKVYKFILDEIFADGFGN